MVKYELKMIILANANFSIVSTIALIKGLKLIGLLRFPLSRKSRMGKAGMTNQLQIYHYPKMNKFMITLSECIFQPIISSTVNLPMLLLILPESAILTQRP